MRATKELLIPSISWFLQYPDWGLSFTVLKLKWDHFQYKHSGLWLCVIPNAYSSSEENSWSWMWTKAWRCTPPRPSTTSSASRTLCPARAESGLKPSWSSGFSVDHGQRWQCCWLTSAKGKQADDTCRTAACSNHTVRALDQKNLGSHLRPVTVKGDVRVTVSPGYIRNTNLSWKVFVFIFQTVSMLVLVLFDCTL